MNSGIYCEVACGVVLVPGIGMRHFYSFLLLLLYVATRQLDGDGIVKSLGRYTVSRPSEHDYIC